MIVAVVWVSGAMRARVESKLREFGANMVVIPRSLDMPIAYGGMNIGTVAARMGELTEEDAALVASIDRKDTLRGVSPKLITGIQIEGKEFLLIGVRFREELKMKPWWKINGAKPALSRDLLLGAETSRQLDKKAGDPLILGGKEFRVAGVLDEQFSGEDSAIVADLREAGLLSQKPGKVSLIEVSTWCSACPIETIVEQISAKLPNAKVFAVKQLVEAELSQVNLFAGFAIALSAIIWVVGFLITLLTMMAAVRERTQEIGVLRAVGFRQRHILDLILLEGITVSLIGGFLGAVLGSVAGMSLSWSFVGWEWSFSLALYSGGIPFVLTLIMGTLPALYAARKASQLDPMSALRAI